MKTRTPKPPRPEDWKRTNPTYETGTPRRVRIPHRETGELVECVEMDACKAFEMAAMGKENA